MCLMLPLAKLADDAEHQFTPCGRVVIYDATYELVWPEHRLPWAALVKAAKMRRASYCEAHRCATSVLQAALNDGRREFHTRLFSRV
ncbi:MAG TPA: hypothetical protein DCY59_10135 [Micrococcaceae bacterium]|nr:hypothetical protein [Micrococcaceae bacterium]